MAKQTYLWILKIGVFLSLLSVFLVFKDFLFPYITSKQISFNILIEILLVFWIAFIVKYPEYRPKKSWISYGLVAFFFALFVSSIFGVDFNLSFWGDVERMLGVFHLLHFLVLYFIIITVMKSWKDWQILFLISVLFAVIVSIVGLVGTHYSTIGNTAYVSGYLIFNIYFALLLLVEEKSKVFRWLYVLPIIFMLLEFKKADTSGAIVGLGFSIFVVLFLYIIFSKNKRIKQVSLGLFILIIVLTGLLFANKNSNFVSQNSVLRIFKDISLEKNTFQTRLISWRAALKDFPNHPILGTGHGNYAIIFDKYFSPNFYDYTRTETYFDRAHNNVIDIMSTSGIVGLFTYLSIFVAAFYYLYQGYRKEKITVNQLVLLIGLISAYFVQNLAVFDSLITYIALMMILGFIYYLVQEAQGDILEIENKGLDNKEIFALAVAGIFSLIIVWQFNLNVIFMLKGSIQGQVYFSRGMLLEGFEEYKKALDYDTILDRDSRDSYIRAIISNPGVLSALEPEKAVEAVDYAVDLAERNLEYNPNDSLMQMQLAQILDIASRMNQNKFYFYSDQALEAIDKAIEASPGRIRIYYTKAQIYSTRGEKDKAIKTLEYAISLNENYYDSVCNLSKYYFFYGDEEKAYEKMDECIDRGGKDLLGPIDFVKDLIVYYTEKDDKERLINLYKRLSELESELNNLLWGGNADTWVNLAKLYAEQGDISEAEKAAQKAAEIDPSLEASVEDFIKGLE